MRYFIAVAMTLRLSPCRETTVMAKVTIEGIFCRCAAQGASRATMRLPPPARAQSDASKRLARANRAL
jgi:hypothetical protein